MAEASRDNPSPADKVQAQVQVDLGFAVSPPALRPIEPQPTAFRIVAFETDGGRTERASTAAPSEDEKEVKKPQKWVDAILITHYQ